jgi:hypothetical protein
VAPDSVVHQYRGENFTTSTWTDTAPSGPQADLSVTGVAATTLGPNGDRAGSSDGIDDFAKSTATGGDGPESLPELAQFGLAFVYRSSSTGDNETYFGSENGSTPSFLRVIDSDGGDGSLGEIAFNMRDETGSELAIETDAKFASGNVNLVVFNKRGNQAADLEIYINDMSSPVASTVLASGFNNLDYSNISPLSFFARNRASGIRFHKDLDASFFEFNEQPYSQRERLELLNRAPGV